MQYKWVGKKLRHVPSPVGVRGTESIACARCGYLSCACLKSVDPVNAPDWSYKPLGSSGGRYTHIPSGSFVEPRWPYARASQAQLWNWFIEGHGLCTFPKQSVAEAMQAVVNGLYGADMPVGWKESVQYSGTYYGPHVGDERPVVKRNADASWSFGTKRIGELIQWVGLANSRLSAVSASENLLKVPTPNGWQIGQEPYEYAHVSGWMVWSIDNGEHWYIWNVAGVGHDKDGTSYGWYDTLQGAMKFVEHTAVMKDGAK